MALALPIYGMNLGTVGFLLNAYADHGLVERISRAQRVKLSPLRMTRLHRRRQTDEAIGINEVSIYREGRQAARLAVAHRRRRPPAGAGLRRPIGRHARRLDRL